MTHEVVIDPSSPRGTMRIFLPQREPASPFESINCLLSNVSIYAQGLHSGLADFLQRALAAYVRVGRIAWSKLAGS